MIFFVFKPLCSKSLFSLFFKFIFHFSKNYIKKPCVFFKSEKWNLKNKKKQFYYIYLIKKVYFTHIYPSWYEGSSLHHLVYFLLQVPLFKYSICRDVDIFIPFNSEIQKCTDSFSLFRGLYFSLFLLKNFHYMFYYFFKIVILIIFNIVGI